DSLGPAPGRCSGATPAFVSPGRVLIAGDTNRMEALGSNGPGVITEPPPVSGCAGLAAGAGGRTWAFAGERAGIGPGGGGLRDGAAGIASWLPTTWTGGG